MASNDISYVIFIPVILCLLAIAFLLSIYRSKRQQQQYLRLAQYHEEIEHDELEEYDERAYEQEEDSIPDDNGGEGSSAATLRIRKVGKKKGEKLRRKEQMRQYREYMDQQRDMRRAQDEIMGEEYRRKKAEEAMQRADEMEKRRKKLAKQAKQDEKERQAQKKRHEKELYQKQKRFKKYHITVKHYVQDAKVCHVEQLAKQFGIDKEEIEMILQELCDTDPDFDLSLWSDDRSTFMYVIPSDYERLAQYIDQHQGKLVVTEAVHNSFLVLGK